jgi:bidirectional [NiFe] hydrogenase diaphorase subunit
LVSTLKGGQTQVQRGDPKHPFFSAQLSVVLANSGYVDPERIESYIAAEGYQALHHVLRELTPKDLIDEIIKSGLRGRGGAGYRLRCEAYIAQRTNQSVHHHPWRSERIRAS